LEKLASIYKEKKQNKSYEIIARKLQKEREKKKKSKTTASLPDEIEELALKKKIDESLPPKDPKKSGDIPPDVESIAPEIEIHDSEAPKPEGAEPEDREPEKAVVEILEIESAPPGLKEETAEDKITLNLDKADRLIQQGLIRNARRILEELKEKFPEDARIDEKIEELGALATQVKEEEIIDQDEMPPAKDTEIFEGSEKLTSAELFADTDIVPLVSQEIGEKRYFDLSQQLEEELEAIKHIFFQQTRGDTTVVEKELSAIVSEFKIKVDNKIGAADLEARYNLGIAYLEQDLIDEAIKEFMLSSQDEKWEMESFTNLGECYKRLNEYGEAIKWYEKAMKLVGADSIQAYALKYEIASLYEAKKESEKALRLFGEVLEWNPEYGDVTSRIKSIEKQAAK
jgi:tetratricopeptide (TPR) repeat protein